MDNKKIEKSCATYEFYFGDVCAGYGTRTDNDKKHMECLWKRLRRCFQQVVVITGYH